MGARKVMREERIEHVVDGVHITTTTETVREGKAIRLTVDGPGEALAALPAVFVAAAYSEMRDRVSAEVEREFRRKGKRSVSVEFGKGNNG